jgi:uncharacterized protein (DUF4415 family)
MDKRELASLVKKKSDNKTVVISIRLDERVVNKLKAKDMDVAETIRNVLQRLAE